MLQSRIGNRAFGRLVAPRQMIHLHQAMVLDLQRLVGSHAVGQLRDGAPRGIQRDDDPAKIENEAMAQIGNLTEANIMKALSTDDLREKSYAEINALLIRVEQILVSTPADNPLHAPLRDYRAAVQAAHREKLERMFSAMGKDAKAIEAINEQVKASQRAEFMETMRVHLGSYEAVEKHFKLIRKVTFAGESLLLHDLAATRLESVNRQLIARGQKMPETTVGFGLRGRFKAHSREPLGHPLGFAIDYHAVENPHVTDPRLWRLLELETERGSSFKLAKPFDDYGKRRRMLEKIGKMTADPAQEDSTVREEFNRYLTSYLSEYSRVQAASRDFGDSLSEQARQRIADVYGMMRTERELLPRVEKKYRKAYATMKKFEQRIAKATARWEAANEKRATRNKPPQPPSKSMKTLERQFEEAQKKVQDLEMEKAALHGNIEKGKIARENIETDFADMFAPWLDAVAAKKAEILDKYSEIEDIPDDPKELKKQRAEADKQVTQARSHKRREDTRAKRLARQVKELDRKLTRAKKPEQIDAIETNLERAHAELVQAQMSAKMAGEELQQAIEHASRLKHLQSKNVQGAKANFENYSKLEEALKGDFGFVFGSGSETHKNPSVAQLIHVGMFTPRENAPDARRQQKLEGFTQEFMRLMAEHGFDHGANWHPGGVDPMHFELTEGLNPLPSSDDRKKALDAVEKKLAGIRKIRGQLDPKPEKKGTRRSDR